MRGCSLSGAALVFLTSSAYAQTAGTYLSSQGAVLLPPAVNLIQPGVTRTENSSGTAVGVDLGNGFKTEIEGVTTRAPAGRLGNVPTGGNLSATSVMLNGLYEISDGAWRLKPYVGAGFGIVDANARVLGATTNDWVAAYQLRGGVQLGFTQKLAGSFEYRWTMGSKPHFSLAGIPTKLEIDRHGFVFGMNFKY